MLASIVGVFAVQATDKDKTDAMTPINRGFLTAGILTVVGTAARRVRLRRQRRGTINAGWKCFGAVVVGLVLAQVRQPPHRVLHVHRDHARCRRSPRRPATGPATVVLVRHRSRPRVVGVRHHRHRRRHRRRRSALGGGNLQFSLYLVALTGMGMLATTGVVVSEDTFGPVADNAAGIAEMSGEFEGEPERIMVSLDAVGNTTKAVTKGFAIGSAVIAAVALFAAYIETIGNELGSALKDLNGNGVFNELPHRRSTWPTRRCSSAC